MDDLIALVVAVDGILQMQSEADHEYFVRAAQRRFEAEEVTRIKALILAAYRYQYIVSGIRSDRFTSILFELITPAQKSRILAALSPLL